MARLATLRSTLAILNTNRAPMLEAKAGTTPRPRGRGWMETRKRVAQAQGYRCVDCGRAWVPHTDQVDHDVPLEEGGSNDDSNLRLRCDPCHAAKTAREATRRSGR